jgi:PAS domain S-box-containing protein
VLCAGLWDFGFAAELLSPTLAGKVFWANLQFLGIAFLPVAWLAITLYATAQPRQNLRLIPALCIIPAITNLLAWTDPYHHLFRQQPFINTVGVPFPVLASDYGLYFYAVHAPYGYLLFAVILFLLIRSWRRSPPIYRRQRLTLVLTLVLPLLIDTAYIFGLTPIRAFNFTSIFFSLSGLLLSFNVLYLRFLDVLPLAYEATVNEMKVGVIVLDAPGRVSHLNPAAEQITGLSNAAAIGSAARQCLPQLDPLWTSPQAHAELTLPRGGRSYTYQLQRTPILHGRQRLVGQVITLDDITALVELTDLLRREQEKSDALLLNVLPQAIAAVLKDENRLIAERFEAVSILFADIVDFTPLSTVLAPTELVAQLNEVFSHLDTLVARSGLEKIKTIGDCYMVAAGVPCPRPDHAHVLADLALEIQHYAAQRTFGGRPLAFRIGINSGPAVAGVIGRKKFAYDLWGDTVNVASRMESHGVAGCIQITAATQALLAADFICEPHGLVEVKGKGAMPVWHVLGRRAQ